MTEQDTFNRQLENQEELRELVAQRRWRILRDRLSSFHPAEIADIIMSTDKKDRTLIFRSLTRDDSAEVFSVLDTDQQDMLLNELTDYETRNLLAEMSPDDRTELLEELPGEMTRRLMSLLSKEDLKEARQMLGYPEESVGRLMTPDYVSVRPDWTISRALDHIQKYGKDSETVNMIYVTDKSGRMLDDFKLRKIILGGKEDHIRKIMDNTFVALSAFDDRERAVSLMKRYDLVALPVIDSKGILVGIVTFDDVMDVAEEEATEDIHKSAAISPLEMNYRNTPVFTLYKKRVGWLIMLVMLNLVSAGVIGMYEEELAQAVILLFFIPILIASGGNTGAQSSTLIIRAMTTGNIKLNQWLTTFFKELSVGALLGVTLGILGGVIGMIRGNYDFKVMFTVAGAMISIVLMGNILGTVFPFILNKLRLDPATASGPLITTVADACGLFIYFVIASAVMGL